MSEQNKALVRKIYQATEAGDAAILDSVVTEDVIEHPLGHTNRCDFPKTGIA